ncbi:sulfotransferase domain-containing protein [Pannus brasiliensis CCIBt3594]|uniref:Sulfotransferase domain-containing protein n=1 Tax=Pannus brasiliensis CCIBt3594 TaxID=1427578 RepID=A0AAW9QPY2_9CHRO
MPNELKDLFQKIVAKFPLPKKKTSPPALLRPFVPSDFQPLPPGWNVKSPDFVGVAAGKSGTSWWYSLLLQHPRVVQNRLGRKELHYFDHFQYRGISEEQIKTYCQAFAAPENSICGEWSPNYLTHPFCMEYLARSAPNTKILILLRNPVDRMLSQMNFLSSHHLNSFNFNRDERYLYQLYTIYLNSCIHSYYTVGLKELLKYFPRSRILVLQYERCKVNPLEEIQKTYRFLEIDDRYQPANIDRPVNKMNYSIAPFTVEERRRVADFFAEEMRSTRDLFPEIDLSLWENA